MKKDQGLTTKRKKLALNNLKLIYKKLSPKYKVCIETDMSPISLINILNEKRFKKLGILLDLGNTRAHGFKIEDYFRLFLKKFIVFTLNIEKNHMEKHKF